MRLACRVALGLDFEVWFYLALETAFAVSVALGVVGSVGGV